MSFYSTLQLNPNDLKKKIKNTESKKEKHTVILAMLVRAVLIVLFSILIITPIAPLFGPENNAVGVALICIILSIRFVDFGYRISDSIINMGIVFLLLWASPMLALSVNPFFAAIIHFISLFVIFAMTSQQPEMGNGGLYAFAYIFLSGNPVKGELFYKRGLLLLIGFLICAVIFYFKHKSKNADIKFLNLIKSFKFRDSKFQWHIQFALGVSILLGLGSAFNIERLMWAGFACASLLGCYTSGADAAAVAKERFEQRIVGAAIGSVLFALIYNAVPQSLHSMFGPVGGICLGFCTEYRYKTALNCFGALMLATGIYGLQGSVLLRITNNLLGAAFGYGFFMLYRKFTSKRNTAAVK